MTLEKVVIIGTGQGAFQLAASLRQEKFEGRILLIGDESGLPYQRPPLSKDYLKDGNASNLLLRPEAFYTRNNIEVISDSRVLNIDRNSQKILTDSGQAINYDHLIIATGTRNLTPSINNLHLKSVFALRTKLDADKIRDFIQTTRKIIIVGGGFIGLEFAAFAQSVGHKVTVIEAGERLMSRAVSQKISAQFLKYHLAKGVSFHFNQFVCDIIDDGNGAADGVKLNDGRIITGDMIVIAAGVIPNSELAEAAGLEVDNGIIVDTFLQTADPNISSLGDCASFPDPISGRQIRLESVQAATDHARTISKKLVGNPLAYSAIPWFWSTQSELKLQIVGLTNDADDYHVLASSEANKKCIFCFKKQIFIGIETINSPKEHMQGRKLLAMNKKFTKIDFEDAHYDLRSLLKLFLRENK